jgi:hypothetical protein
MKLTRDDENYEIYLYETYLLLNETPLALPEH